MLQKWKTIEPCQKKKLPFVNFQSLFLTPSPLWIKHTDINKKCLLKPDIFPINEKLVRLGFTKIGTFPFRPFNKPIYRRKAVFYYMVRILLNCSFHALLKLYVIRRLAGHVKFTLPCPLYRKHFILGLLNSLVNLLKALKIYVLFIIFIITSCIHWHSIFRLLDAKKEQAVIIISFVIMIISWKVTHSSNCTVLGNNGIARLFSILFISNACHNLLQEPKPSNRCTRSKIFHYPQPNMVEDSIYAPFSFTNVFFSLTRISFLSLSRKEWLKSTFVHVESIN